MVEQALYNAGRSVVNLYAGLMLDLDVVRRTPFPEGPKIIAANHPSTTDPLLITTLAAEQTSVLIHETLFKVPLFGRYLRLAGHVPVVDGNGRAAFEQAQRLLRAGRTVVVFPEGGLSPLEGGFGKPRTGAARLSLSTGAPVIPAGIHLQRERIRLIETQVAGQAEVGRWYIRGPYAITVGEPMHFRGDVEDRAHVAAVSEQIMRRIVELARESAGRLGVREAQPPTWSQIRRTVGLYASTLAATLLFGSEGWFLLQQGQAWLTWLRQAAGRVWARLRAEGEEDPSVLAKETPV